MLGVCGNSCDESCFVSNILGYIFHTYCKTFIITSWLSVLSVAILCSNLRILFSFHVFFSYLAIISRLQDGMLKHKGTYEIISPEDIGLERSNEAGIVLGKLRYVMAPLFFFVSFMWTHITHYLSLEKMMVIDFLIYELCLFSKISIKIQIVLIFVFNLFPCYSGRHALKMKLNKVCCNCSSSRDIMFQFLSLTYLSLF